MAFDSSRPADLAWLGNNTAAFGVPIVPLSPVTPPVDTGTYPQPGQFAMPSIPPAPTVADQTDPVLAAYLQAAKTPNQQGGTGVAPPATSIAYQTSAGTASKPGVFIIIVVLVAVAFWYLKKKGAIHVG